MRLRPGNHARFIKSPQSSVRAIVFASRNNEESMNSLSAVRRDQGSTSQFSMRMRYVVSVLLLTFFTVGLTANPNSKAGHATRGSAKNVRVAPARSQFSAVDKLRIQRSYGKLPLRFEPNLGQSNPRVKFLSRGSGYTLFLSHEEATLSLFRTNSEENPPQIVADPSQPAHQAPSTTGVLRMQFLGGAAAGSVHGLHALSAKSNYLVGNDAKRWQRNVTNFAALQSDALYPGIDVIYHGDQGQLEYDFDVAPGADPRVIAMRFSGARRVAIDPANGDLVLKVADEEVRFHKPVAYQQSGAEKSGDSAEVSRSLVAADYVISAHGQVSFRLGPYDHHKSLVIDPTLSYSTYLGGSADDFATSLAVDAAGSVYISGYTSSVNFPVSAGAFQSSCAGGCTSSDAFVTKLDPTGTSVIYSTYIGGTRSDLGNGIAIDGSGDAFLVGQTSSTDFPVTSGALQTSCGGSCAATDVFVAELDPTGSTLVYSTYLGGSGIDQGNAIVLDAQNNAFITGFTQSTNFPVTPGVFQMSCSCSTRPDAYVAEINSTGSALLYATYLGGATSVDVAYALALDPSDNVYVTGYTSSTDFPVTSGAYQTKIAAAAAGFVTKINPTGTALLYSTLLGGSSSVLGTSCEACSTIISIDSAGDAYVGGLTAEANFPTTPGAFQNTFKSTTKGHDAFVTELNPAGSALVFSTYLGGTGDDGVTGLAVDPSGNVWLSGNTKSTDFPVTSGAFRTASAGNFDHYLAEFNPTGTALLYSTYIGGAGIEFGGATKMLVIDSQNPPNVYLTGYTNSTNFPTTAGAFQTTDHGGNDGHVSKFVPSPNVGLSPSSVDFGTQLVGATSSPRTVTVTNTGNQDLPAPTIQLSGANSPDFAESDTCSSTISPQSSCTVTLTFTPTLFAGEKATITLTDSAPDSPQTISLTGTGIQQGPAMTVSPSTLNFIRTVIQTSSAPKTITVTNTGTDLITITSLTVTGDYSQTNTCGSSIAAGTSCTISVTFKPTVINSRTGTVTITDNAPTSPQTVSLSGVGTQVQFSPLSLNFANVKVGATAKMPVNLTNVGTNALSVTKVSITGTGASDYTQTNTCGSTVAAGATCAYTVSFTPSIKGARVATLSISDSGGGSPQGVSLTGQGQ
jgi:hypothetical protein